jgi:hypothetical protein
MLDHVALLGGKFADQVGTEDGASVVRCHRV